MSPPHFLLRPQLPRIHARIEFEIVPPPDLPVILSRTEFSYPYPTQPMASGAPSYKEFQNLTSSEPLNSKNVAALPSSFQQLESAEPSGYSSSDEEEGQKGSDEISRASPESAALRSPSLAPVQLPHTETVLTGLTRPSSESSGLLSLPEQGGNDAIRGRMTRRRVRDQEQSHIPLAAVRKKIPKPPGEPNRRSNGYPLDETLEGLGWQEREIKTFRERVKELVISTLNLKLSYSRQKEEDLTAIRDEIMHDETWASKLDCYEDWWPITGAIKAVLRYQVPKARDEAEKLASKRIIEAATAATTGTNC